MGYELTFSHAFTISDRDHHINDCCFAGDVIAEHLRPAAVLAEHSNVETGQEDWGWFIWFRSGSVGMSVDIDCQDIDAGDFAIRISARRPRFLLGSTPVDGPELDQLRDRVVSALRAWLGVEPTIAPFNEQR